MKTIRIFALGLLCLAGGAASALASSSDWFETEGGRIRLVTSGAPDAEGRLTGILDIDLKPGWKTYWRDPGEAGVPPTLDVAKSRNLDSAAMEFPPPQRHDEADFRWAGYDHPVAFPVTFRVKSLSEPATVEADIFLGICQTICIPVQASLSLDPSADPDNAADKAAVLTAAASLPAPARVDFGVTVASKPGDTTLRLDAVFPGDPDSAELFIAGTDGYSFTTPQRVVAGGKVSFTVEVSMPAGAGTGPGIPYTLVTDAGSVSGFLPNF